MTRSQLIGRVAPIAAAILVAGTLVGVSSRTTPSPATDSRGGPPSATATAPTMATAMPDVTVAADATVAPDATAAATPPAVAPADTTSGAATPTSTAGTATTLVPPPGKCDPNYAGCVPLAADVDCAGEGDGPAHVIGPIQVLHKDRFGLDPDHNGIACD